MDGGIVSGRMKALVAAGMLIPLVLVGLPAFLAFRSEGATQESFRWVAHTLEVEEKIESVLNTLLDAESSQRGYLLTQRDYHLQPYFEGLRRLPGQVKELRALTSDNASQQARLNDLEVMIENRVSLLKEVVGLHRKGAVEQALNLMKTDRGKHEMDRIRRLMREMQQEEQQLLAERQDGLFLNARLGTTFLTLLAGFAALFSAGVLILFHRLARVRSLVRICAWSKAIEYEGAWLSFEEYLRRRFGIEISAAVSPGQAGTLFGQGTGAPVRPPKGPAEQGWDAGTAWANEPWNSDLAPRGARKA